MQQNGSLDLYAGHREARPPGRCPSQRGLPRAGRIDPLAEERGAVPRSPKLTYRLMQNANAGMLIWGSGERAVAATDQLDRWVLVFVVGLHCSS